ncbi:TauD/TfdA dioxygenase family protein [Streptomyces sp. NPDC058664]|uniref:TauD/TfdA dioxygenase family protein n=1 Tax=unclassified Streptomyces TaxID=2593676 RepID=UPI003657218B
MIEIKPISVAAGAEVRGIDLSEEITTEDWAVIEKAFHEYSVLVFRGQDLTVEQQKTFAERFGKLIVHDHLLPMTVDGHPECMVLHNNAQKPPGLNSWHTDNSGWAKPPLGTVLHCKVTPDVGGDTLYSNMHLAYEALSPVIRELVDQLKAVHDVKKAFGPDYANLQASLRKKGIDPNTHFDRHEPVEHPVVRTHPETLRKALYISSPYVTHISGLSKIESQALLDLLYRHIETNEFIYRHQWRAGDLLIWDNRSVQHLAVADYFPHERLMFRMNIEGERPF